ncbi:MAG: alanine--glyoxylate aminotransferase family protein, partial [Gaiellales bacterium]
MRRHPLLDHAPPTPAEFAATETSVQRILRTDGDVVLVQAEAALALEAVLAGLVRTGTRALCLSSGTYGAWFARELAKLGAEVTTISVDSRAAIEPSTVAEALER